jgi:dTDP-glucose pyrophosphorylase
MPERGERSYGYQAAILLAGGQGTRLRRLGAVLPKCLLPVYDQPILFRQIGQSVLAGARLIIISIAEKYHEILDAALRLYDVPDGVTLCCVPEREPLGAPAGLAALARHVRGLPCLVILGDEYYASDRPFVQLGSRRPSDTQMVVGVIASSIPARIACNVVLDQAQRIVRIRDKPPATEIEGDVRWACLCALDAGVLDIGAELLRSGRMKGPYIGDFFDMLRAAGITTGPLYVPEVELNINTLDDLILGSLIEARRSAAASPQPTLSVDQALESLLRHYGLSLSHVHA